MGPGDQPLGVGTAGTWGAGHGQQNGLTVSGGPRVAYIGGAAWDDK